MKALQVIYLLVVISLISGCGQGHTALIKNPQKNYSVEIENHAENALLDGLPEGTSITNVNNALLRKINNKLSAKGMNNNNAKNIIKAKYEIEYFNHKYIPFSNVKYGIKYNLELSNKLTGKVFYSQKLGAWDSDLNDITDEISNDIIKNILKNEKYILSE